MEEWRFNSGDSRLVDYFFREGFAVVENVLSEAAIAPLVNAIAAVVGPDGYARRNVLQAFPELRELAGSPEIRSLVEPVLGADAFPVKGILFDKTPTANWKVAWHQDNMIAVRERIDARGFGPWSNKEGILHVQPPALVLGGIMTVRVHLDDCGSDNGPLRVISASHRKGLLDSVAIDASRARRGEVVCTVPRRGVLLMRPLTLHASSTATAPQHRRVIHLEYSATPLPCGLQWAKG